MSGETEPAWVAAYARLADGLLVTATFTGAITFTIVLGPLDRRLGDDGVERLAYAAPLFLASAMGCVTISLVCRGGVVCRTKQRLWQRGAQVVFVSEGSGLESVATPATLCIGICTPLQQHPCSGIEPLERCKIKRTCGIRFWEVIPRVLRVEQTTPNCICSAIFKEICDSCCNIAHSLCRFGVVHPILCRVLRKRELRPNLVDWLVGP